MCPEWRPSAARLARLAAKESTEMTMPMITAIRTPPTVPDETNGEISATPMLDPSPKQAPLTAGSDPLDASGDSTTPSPFRVVRASAL